MMVGSIDVCLLARWWWSSLPRTIGWHHGCQNLRKFGTCMICLAASLWLGKLLCAITFISPSNGVCMYIRLQCIRLCSQGARRAFDVAAVFVQEKKIAMHPPMQSGGTQSI